MDIVINFKFDHLNNFSVVSRLTIIDEGRKQECIRYQGIWLTAKIASKQESSSYDPPAVSSWDQEK